MRSAALTAYPITPEQNNITFFSEFGPLYQRERAVFERDNFCTIHDALKTSNC